MGSRRVIYANRRRKFIHRKQYFHFTWPNKTRPRGLKSKESIKDSNRLSQRGKLLAQYIIMYINTHIHFYYEYEQLLQIVILFSFIFCLRARILYATRHVVVIPLTFLEV